MDKAYVLAASIILAAVIIAMAILYRPVQAPVQTITTITMTTQTTSPAKTTIKTTTTTTIKTTTRFEKLEIILAYAEQNKSIPGWTVHIKVKNTGNIEAIIDNVLINNVPYRNYDISLKPGQEKELLLFLDNKHYSSGQTISIIIHTSSGGQYPTTITLP